MMALAQQPNCLLGCSGNGRARGRGEEYVIQPVRSADALHRRSVGHGNEVILVGTTGRRTFGLKDSNHAARHRLYADALAHRILARKEVLHHGLAKYADWYVLLYVLVSKDRSALYFPLANVEIFRGHPAISRIPIQRSIDHLHAAVNIRTHALQSGNLGENRGGILHFEAVGFTRAEAHTVGRAAARLDPNHVVAQFR